jgi:hypothetical protein
MKKGNDESADDKTRKQEDSPEPARMPGLARDPIVLDFGKEVLLRKIDRSLRKRSFVLIEEIWRILESAEKSPENARKPA